MTVSHEHCADCEQKFTIGRAPCPTCGSEKLNVTENDDRNDWKIGYLCCVIRSLLYRERDVVVSECSINERADYVADTKIKLNSRDDMPSEEEQDAMEELWDDDPWDYDGEEWAYYIMREQDEMLWQVMSPPFSLREQAWDFIKTDLNSDPMNSPFFVIFKKRVKST